MNTQFILITENKFEELSREVVRQDVRDVRVIGEKLFKKNITTQTQSYKTILGILLQIDDIRSLLAGLNKVHQRAQTEHQRVQVPGCRRSKEIPF